MAVVYLDNMSDRAFKRERRVVNKSELAGILVDIAKAKTRNKYEFQWRANHYPKKGFISFYFLNECDESMVADVRFK